jgi:hypothetical protein
MAGRRSAPGWLRRRWRWIALPGATMRAGGRRWRTRNGTRGRATANAKGTLELSTSTPRWGDEITIAWADTTIGAAVSFKCRCRWARTNLTISAEPGAQDFTFCSAAEHRDQKAVGRFWER